LRDSCAGEVRRLAADSNAPTLARGMALEHLAMIRDRSARTAAEAWRGAERAPARRAAPDAGQAEGYGRRALLIAGSPE
jgi:hypothetical protein